MATQLTEPMNTFETNHSILPQSDDKIEQYKSLIQQLYPFTQSLVSSEKIAALDFHILLKSAINERNNQVLVYLNDAIEHLIKQFMRELTDLIEKRIDWNSGPNVHYNLINDLTCVITQTVLHKQNQKEFREFCLKI
jgi:hypothetical protein